MAANVLLYLLFRQLPLLRPIDSKSARSPAPWPEQSERSQRPA